MWRTHRVVRQARPPAGPASRRLPARHPVETAPACREGGRATPAERWSPRLLDDQRKAFALARQHQQVRRAIQVRQPGLRHRRANDDIRQPPGVRLFQAMADDAPVPVGPRRRDRADDRQPLLRHEAADEQQQGPQRVESQRGAQLRRRRGFDAGPEDDGVDAIGDVVVLRTRARQRFEVALHRRAHESDRVGAYQDLARRETVGRGQHPAQRRLQWHLGDVLSHDQAPAVSTRQRRSGKAAGIDAVVHVHGIGLANESGEPPQRVRRPQGVREAGDSLDRVDRRHRLAAHAGQVRRRIRVAGAPGDC